MKKTSILLVLLVAICMGVFAIYTEKKAPSAEKAIKAIEEAQNNINK